MRTEKVTDPLPTTSSVAETNEAEAPLTFEEQIKLIQDDTDTLFTVIEDVTGGDSTGGAFAYREDGQLLHYVSAKLPPPSTGQFYEGWLVKSEPSLSFFSTGVMKKATDMGWYELFFLSEQLYPEYNQVVITLETRIDEIPERHILVGSFRNTRLE